MLDGLRERQWCRRRRRLRLLCQSRVWLLRLPDLGNTFLSGRLLLQGERERDGDDDDDALLKENWKARSRTHSFFFFFFAFDTHFCLSHLFCFWIPAAGSYHPFFVFLVVVFSDRFFFFLSDF